MPNKWTFKIKPIRKLLDRYVKAGQIWIDPFAGMNSPASITNDIDISKNVEYHEDGLEFLKRFNNYAYGALFDPPYTVEQCLRKYKAAYKGTAGRTEYHSECKKAISRALKIGGISISFGYDSGGIGKKHGFEIIEILLVCHGACHYDTIVTVDKKIK